ncbi:two-component system, sensor histidine kinase YesM [Paenibacillus sp. UNCCL117]|uniref:cache domain-containing sensor histidine kinase n=1 Tax=unclassified Paenibacillus TaxID=185978 RepID=UPI000884695F|nr:MULTISPECIES: sensor histidine kinase [unclassified Paenibacillus]SDE19722.1 two-component system, sensor histidine kinase YesM [Paenibacillus sp. cl123]SFW61950.1 two-component system, sensor histidine kinase YesM [Paenibacillus sp. UNCCL117]
MLDRSKLSFRSKLRLAFLVVTILSVLLTGGLSYSITSSIIENHAMKLTQDSVSQSAQIVDEKLNKLMLVMMTFMISQPFRVMLKDVNAGDASRYFTRLTELDNMFSQARIAEPLIHSIYVATPIGEFYPLSMNRNRQVSFEDTPLYARIAREKRNIWIEGHEDTLFLGKNRVVSLILQPISEDPVKDVYVVVNIREEGLRQLLSTGADGGAARFLLAGDGKPVARETSALIGQAVASGALGSIVDERPTGYTPDKLNGKAYLFNYARLGLNDWSVVAIQSKDHVLKELIYVKWIIAAITAGCFLLTVLVSGAFTRYLLLPLRGLQQVMKRVELNDLAARFESKSNDELAQVGFRFNRMLEQIVKLIDEVKEAETNKRATEIKALSAQMDPHFLYNTLNTIYWKLKLHQVEPSQKMVVALSRLFQLGLNKGQEMTTLDKELQHVRQYLELQTFCYEQLFTYAIEADDELRELAVPRIMLQPLVENSIVHGFDQMDGGGVIRIRAFKSPEGQSCCIQVIDNGAGMPKAPSAQADAKATGERRGAGSGYAIGNLRRRLELYYGDRAGLSLEGAEGEGVTATITIPLEEVL